MSKDKKFGDCQTLIRKRIGVVDAVRAESGGVSELTVFSEGRLCAAINYTALTGPAQAGDLVLLNNTALYLGLGTGGTDFIYHNFSAPDYPCAGRGHIMKLRYTPCQIRVLSCEEEDAGNQDRLAAFQSLELMPVLIGELHSMLSPAVAVIKYYRPACRVVYLMSDGGALPAAFSRTLAELKGKGLLEGSISSGHAFGGDLEAVNVYSALVAAKEILKADLVIVAMGPGNVGTGTRFGFSGMEVGEHINRVNALGGIPIVIPRISFADQRLRHRGISHHTLTALGFAACSTALLILPKAGFAQTRLMLGQLARRGLHRRHRVLVRAAPPLEKIMQYFCLSAAESMGRGYHDDPLLFNAAAAAAATAVTAMDLIPKAAVDRQVVAAIRHKLTAALVKQGNRLIFNLE
jgi:hypothetical protein